MLNSKSANIEDTTEKIVVLNSGGFDSAVLLNDIYNTNLDAEIISLHFVYGALNERSQRKCVNRMCRRLRVRNHIIKIPKISWTENSFYHPFKEIEYSSQYLEYRNLIFLSYAVSFAQSIGAKKIYLAILKSHGYCDTSKQFIEGLNLSIKESGIQIIAPYSDKEKIDLWSRAKFYGIRPNDFISCDSINACGKCGDCLATKGYTDFLRIDNTRKAFDEYETIDTEEFEAIYMTTPIKEVRLLINNKCQLKCSHCFYGFEDMKSEALSFSEMTKVIDEAVALGVESFHFSGKEPLIDSTIFEYAEYIHNNYPEVIYDVVTNGITIPKFSDDLVEYGFKRVCLSVDDIDDSNGVREVKGVTKKALEALMGKDILVEVFIDLHQNNILKVRDIIKSLYLGYGVTRFFIRTIRNLKEEDRIEVSLEDLNHLYNDLYNLASSIPDIFITLNLGTAYMHKIYSENRMDDLYCACYFTDHTSNTRVLKNFVLSTERFCNKYTSQITVTPDGYVLGCGAEVSCKDYDLLSAGNVRNHSLSTLISCGKTQSYKTQCEKCVVDGEYIIKNCPHSLAKG